MAANPSTRALSATISMSIEAAAAVVRITPSAFCLAVALTPVSGTTVEAADPPGKSSSRALTNALIADDWTGFYAGAHLGNLTRALRAALLVLDSKAKTLKTFDQRPRGPVWRAPRPKSGTSVTAIACHSRVGIPLRELGVLPDHRHALLRSPSDRPSRAAAASARAGGLTLNEYIEVDHAAVFQHDLQQAPRRNLDQCSIWPVRELVVRSAQRLPSSRRPAATTRRSISLTAKPGPWATASRRSATTAALQAAPAGFGNPVLLLPSLAETSSTGALGNAFTGIT